MSLTSHRTSQLWRQWPARGAATIVLAAVTLVIAPLSLMIGQAVQAQQLILRTTSLAGEEWNYIIRSWQSQEDLPELAVQAVTQSVDGYLWLGTTGGLLRFDGEHFRVFDHENTPAMNYDNVFSLLATADRHLWIGMDGGGLLEMKNGVMRAYATRGSVRAIVQDKNGVVWVATDGGLFWVKNGHLERALKSLKLTRSPVDAAIIDHTGRIWFGGARLYYLKDGQAHEYVLPGNDSRSQVKSLLETKDGVIWVGTVVGLYRLRPGRSSLERVPGVFGTIRALCQVPNGEVWVGATGGGIFRLHGDSVIHIRAPSPMISDTVYSIMVDTDGDLWIGTLAGVMRLSRTPMRILSLPEPWRSDLGTVSLDTDDSLWGASYELVHVKGDLVETVRFPALGNVRVRAFLRSRDGSIWIGTVGSGVYHYSAHGVKHLTMNNGLPNNSVRSFFEASDGSMWIAYESGLSRLDGDGLRNFRGLYRPSDTVRAFLEDRDGTIWIGTDGGLKKYRNGGFVRDSLTAALNHEMVWALQQDADGSVWVGTRAHGLYRYRDGQLTHYTTANGLVSNNIYSILADKEKHLWISGPTGVMLLNRNELDAQVSNPNLPLSLRYYRASEGNASMHIFGGMYQEAVLTKAGEAWFATSLGLWGIPSDELHHPLFSHLYIESVTVDGRPATTLGQLNLSAEASRVEIEYEPVLLRPQNDLRVRYKLEGFDRKWIYPNAQQRVATYTNLPSGEFEFLVEAWETDHPEHIIRTSMRLSKKQHFYQTDWFIALCALAVTLVFLIAHRLRMAQIHGRFNAVLAERTRVAREIHDTVIQGCIGVSTLLRAASTTEIDNESQAQLIDHAAKQIHATVDEARQAVWDLRSNEAGKSDIQMMLKQMVERIAHEYDLELNCRTLGKSFPIGMQMVHDLMMVARESIFNAILHGRARCVSVELGFFGETVSLIIEDNGNGFDDTVAAPEGHFGLDGMKERIERYDGRCQVNSTIGMGTRVLVEIPRVAIALQ